MIRHEFVVVVLLLEAVVCGVGVVLLLGHAAWRELRAAWLRPRVRAVWVAVAHTLAGDEHDAALPWVPFDEAVHVMAEATRSVDVRARGRLTALRCYRGLDTRAVRWCSSRRWSRRLKGVRLLTILGAGEDTVPPLLDDPRPEVRSEAAAWTAHHPSPAGVDRLVGMLSDDALSCRLVAQATLIRIGRSVLGQVARHLAGPEPAALASTLTVAAQLNDPILLGPALSHQHHPDPGVRAAVAKVLTSLGGAESVYVLESYLADSAPQVRAIATAGLGELGHWPSAPLLAHGIGDPAWEVRSAAGLALRRLGGPGRLYLQRASQSADPFVVDMAQQVLDLPERTKPEQTAS